MGNLPPYTNVSLKMILTNPEGRKESDETVIQTDEDGMRRKSHFLFPCAASVASFVSLCMCCMTVDIPI